MRLTQLFIGEKQIEDGRTQRVDQSAQNAAYRQLIRSLTPGQTLLGEVLAKDGNNVQIRLAENMILNARLATSMNLEIGRNMTFEVKNNGQALILSPLFENMATDENVLKALDMASLPVDETTVSMTGKLMEAGLPIDKNTLQQVYREINSFLHAEISDVVDLHRLGIPVNEDNLNQIAAYKNMTYQLEKGFESIADEIPKTLFLMVQNGEGKEAAQLFSELFKQTFGAEENPQALLKDILLSLETSESEIQGAENETQGTGNAGQDFLAQISKALEKQEVSQTALTEQYTEESGTDRVIIKEGTEGNSPVGQENANASVSDSGAGNMDASKQAALQKLLEQLFTSDGPAAKKAVKELQKAFIQTFREHFSISPEEVADEKKVEELYDRLTKQLKSINHSFEAVEQTGAEAAKATANLSKNIDFLQQLNQAYTYVQLPLKLQQSTAHGDLYVFTNKKNLARKEGQISALLHLDMEHLGPVDVYVAMQAERVNTKFYVQDEAMLDFLEAHMDVLTARLQKRGYSCGVEMLVRENKEEATGGVMTFLQKENHTPLAQYAFDMRA